MHSCSYYFRQESYLQPHRRIARRITRRITFFKPIDAERINKLKETSLIKPFLRGQINILHSKLNLIPLGPFQIIDQTPRNTSDDIDAFAQRDQYRFQIVVVIGCTGEVETDVAEELF